MTNSNIRQFDLEQVHLALRISTPLNELSPMVLYTLTVIARCWRGRVPANLWAEVSHAAAPRQSAPAQPPAKPGATRPIDFEREARFLRVLQTKSGITHPVDNKRRASGDFE